MLELALQGDGAPLQAHVIAERQEISEKYLHAILSSLRTAGLVSSVRGALGGYALARRPGEIDLAQIVRAVEGPLSVVDCVYDERLCHRSSSCATRTVWESVTEAIEVALSTVTLEDLVARHARRSSDGAGG